MLPSAHQPPLPVERLLLREPLDAEAVPMDVIFVGGGPAGFAGAIELARLVKRDAESGGSLGDVQIAVLEKAAALGEHSLSGAVVNPVAFRELFPDLKDSDFPFRAPVTKERVYVMGPKKEIWAVDEMSGATLGRYPTNLLEFILTNTVDEYVYVANSSGHVFCLKESRQSY